MTVSLLAFSNNYWTEDIGLSCHLANSWASINHDSREWKLKKKEKNDRFRALINALLLPFRTSKFQFSHEQSTILTSTMKLIYSSRLCFNIMRLWPEELTGLRPFQMLTASPSAAGHTGRWYIWGCFCSPSSHRWYQEYDHVFFESSQVSFTHFALFVQEKTFVQLLLQFVQKDCECHSNSW